MGAGVRLDAYGSTQPGPWFGLLARYVDERNYYYLSVRGSGSESTYRTAASFSNFSAVQP